MEDFNCSLGIVLIDYKGDVGLRGALADHADVDALAAQRSEQPPGNARGARHALAHDGDDTDIIVTDDVTA